MKIMKLVKFGCAAVAAILTVRAQATWTYDSAAGTISDGNWEFNVTADGDDLTITHWTEGKGALDLTTFYTDTQGKRVVATAYDYTHHGWGGIFCFSTAITSIVAPDLKTITDSTFANCSAITKMSLSPDMTAFPSKVFRCLNVMTEFSPVQSSKLTAIHSYAFVYACQDLAAGSSTFDFDFPALTTLQTHAFEGAGMPRSLVATNLAEITGSEVFLDNKGIRWLRFPKLSKFTSARFCKNCPSLADVRLGGTFTSLPADAFNNCTSLTNLVIKAPVTEFKAGALTNIAPNASVTLYGEAPTLATGSLSSSDDSRRVRVYSALGTNSASWAAAVAPHADQFEADKTRADYPGEKAFGLLWDGTAYSWAIKFDYQLSVSSALGEIGTVSPAFGKYYELTDGTEISFSAPIDDQSVSETLKVRYTGWKLYTVAADGSRTLKAEDDTTSGSFTYESGKSYDLVWEGVRLHRVKANAATGGTVSPDESFVVEGESVTLTPVPDEGQAFGMWTGVPVARLIENPLVLVVTNAVTVTPAFSGKWTYDSEAMVISNDVWCLNVTAEGKNLTIDKSKAGVTGSGQLLLTSFPTDTDGYHVVAFADCDYHDSFNVTALVAPEVASVGDWAFYYRSGLETVYLSSAITRIGYGVFRNSHGVRRFYPSRMPNLTTIGGESFILFGQDAVKYDASSCELVDFDLPALTTLDAISIFPDTGLIRSFRAENLMSVANAQFQMSGSNVRSLERVELGGTFTSIPASMFSGCTVLSNIVLTAPVATVGDNAFLDVAPNARLTFYGAAPTSIGAGSLSAKDAEANDCRICIQAVTAGTDPSWANAVAPNASVFQSYRGKPDDPGATAIGLLYDGTSYAWVTRCDYSLDVRMDKGLKLGSVSPTWGYHFGFADGATVAFTAPEGDEPVSETLKVNFAGWKLYAVGSDGAATLLDSGKGRSGSFTYRKGTFYRLVWETANKYLVTVPAVAGGTVDWTSAFVADGSTVTLTATPGNGHAFGMWDALTADKCALNPVTFTVTEPMTVTPFFNGKWYYNETEGYIYNDVWHLNVTADGADLAISMKTNGVAGSGPLCLTSFPTDVPGFHVTSIAGCIRGFSIFSQDPVRYIDAAQRLYPTAFVAPEVTSVGTWVFAYKGYFADGACSTFVFSEDFASFAEEAFYLASRIHRFHPTTMPRLTSVGTQGLLGAPDQGDMTAFDFIFPALENLSEDSAIRGNRMFASVTAVKLVSMADNSFRDCTVLTNAVFGQNLATIGNNCLSGLAGGATICLPGRHAPTIGTGSLYSADAENRARVLIRRNFTHSGWGDLVTPLTDEDRARADYPGEMTIGTISAIVGDVTNTTWVVETEKPKGLSIILR